MILSCLQLDLEVRLYEYVPKTKTIKYFLITNLQLWHCGILSHLIARPKRLPEYYIFF